MKPGLQHTQMLAVRAAMQGDNTILCGIRESRNIVPNLSQNIDTLTIAPTMKLFKPKRSSATPRPILLYLHGGGWCIGSINSCSLFCAAVALQADCIVVALDYRLALSFPYPAALNDYYEAFNFLKLHGEEWGATLLV